MAPSSGGAKGRTCGLRPIHPKLRLALLLLVILIALAAVVRLSSRLQELFKPQAEIFAWSVPEEQVERISISLPGESQGVASIKQGGGCFYFEQPQGVRADVRRWGGITLLLSGPKAVRLVAEEMGEDGLAEFGLDGPQMPVRITLSGGQSLEVLVGDETPSGKEVYMSISGSYDVYTVDLSWQVVIRRLGTDPPLPQESSWGVLAQDAPLGAVVFRRDLS